MAQGLLAEVVKQAVGGGFWWVTTATAVVFAVSWGLRRLSVRQGAAREESACAPNGLGAVVHLPVAGGRAESPFGLAQWEAKRAFRTRPVSVVEELPNTPLEREAGIARAHVAFQEEILKWNGPAEDVALYLIAKVPDAFTFGRMLGSGPRGILLMQLGGTTPAGGRQFFGAVRLGSRHPAPLGRRGRRLAERFLHMEKVDWPENADAKRIALVLLLTGCTDARGEMLTALRTGRSEKYAVDPGDRCRAALIVSARDGALPQTRDAFELTVRFIQEQWSDWGEQHADDPDKLLAAAAPSTVVTGLGFVFARGSVRVVEHTPTTGESGNESEVDHSRSE